MTSLNLSYKVMHRTHGASSQLKRTTCNVCRERKVRCDREKPQCQRCRKSGHRCVYSTESTDKDEIKSALNVLHSRLVQAETRLQEHGLQNTTTKSTNSSSAISSNLTSGDPQLVYDLVLQQGDEMDYADFTLLEFDDSSNRQPQPILDSVNTTGIDESHSEQTLNLTNTYTETTIPSDIISAVPPDFMSYMWQPSMTVTHEPTGPAMNQQPGETRPFLGLERQYQAYFDIVQKHIMLIDQQEFTQSVISVKTHQCMALKSAVAMSGLSACGESVLAMQSYSTARFHLERAENLVDGSSFLNLETVQALLLISRFEFSHISGPKGLMTLAQAMQLISVQGYDMLDQSSAESDKDTCQTLLPKSPESDNLWKIRRTYWTAFTMHCNAAASFPCCIPVKDKGIFTALPVSDSNLNSGTDTAIYLSDEVTKTTAKGFNVFAVFILSMKLVVEGDRHRQMTRNYVSDSASDYNFCLVHEKIGGELTAMFNSLSTVDFLNGPDVELRVLTLMIILGARIDWFKTAIIGSQKAAFLGPIAKEYQTSCLSVANAMCDLLQQADVTEAKQINAYKEMSFFIMRPLILAAEVLLDTLQNPQDTGFNASSTTREVRHNLRMLCNTMTICKPETGKYDLRIQACSSFLDKSKLDGVFSTGFFRDESR